MYGMDIEMDVNTYGDKRAWIDVYPIVSVNMSWVMRLIYLR